jgi:hypothetical protein
MTRNSKMDIKPEKFPKVTLLREPFEFSGTWDEVSWDSGPWQDIKRCYADTIQHDLLRALHVVGIPLRYWKTVFKNLYNGEGEWLVVNKNWFEKKETPTWHQLVDLVMSTCNGDIQYPPHRAALVAQYGYDYTQFQYLTDLKEYWNDIANGYYRPWWENRVGYDTVVSEALQSISMETQAEVEQLIQSAKLVLQLVQNGVLHDNGEQDTTAKEHV